MQFILDKVAAPREIPRVSRPRLLRLLEEGLDSCTSTLITGRAGTGKTLLATDFARRCGPRVAWYKVDASDGELRIFFRYLIEAVSRQRPGFGQKVLAHFAGSPGPEDIPTLAEAFLYELQEGEGEPLLIVVDDLHLIYDAEWVVPFFQRLLPLLPPEAHMLIIGRSAPPSPCGACARSRRSASSKRPTWHSPRRRRLTCSPATASKRATRTRRSNNHRAAPPFWIRRRAG